MRSEIKFRKIINYDYYSKIKEINFIFNISFNLLIFKSRRRVFKAVYRLILLIILIIFFLFRLENIVKSLNKNI